MVLEYIIMAGVVLFCIGFIGILIRKEAIILSVVILAFSQILVISGFSLFWKSAVGISAIFMILTFLIIQVLVSFAVLSDRE